MNRLISAIQFLTILPMGPPKKFDSKGMVQFFPIVGIILGAMVSVFDLAASHLWPTPVVAILDVIFLVVLTGAFHIDGLGDTADGLLGHRPKEEALSIMKDSRIGVMGLVAIVSGLLIKWGGISGLDAHRSLSLLVIPAYARGSMIFGIKFLEYGRPSGGTGQSFFNSTLTLNDFWGLLVPLALSVFLGWRAILLNLAFVMVTGAVILYYKQRMDCITGDMLGAMAEATESLLFLFVSIAVISL